MTNLAKFTSLPAAALVAALLTLTGCSDTENIDRTEVTGSSESVVSAASTVAPTSSVATATTGAAAWNLADGPDPVAERIDELSGQDAGVQITENALTVYVNGEHPQWLTDLEAAAKGSPITVTVVDADYGRQYLLSAAQELLPQVLPLGVTGLRPADDLSSLVAVIGPELSTTDRATAQELAAGLSYPVTLTFGS